MDVTERKKEERRKKERKKEPVKNRRQWPDGRCLTNEVESWLLYNVNLFCTHREIFAFLDHPPLLPAPCVLSAICRWRLMDTIIDNMTIHPTIDHGLQGKLLLWSFINLDNKVYVSFMRRLLFHLPANQCFWNVTIGLEINLILIATFSLRGNHPNLMLPHVV